MTDTVRWDGPGSAVPPDGPPPFRALVPPNGERRHGTCSGCRSSPRKGTGRTRSSEMAAEAVRTESPCAMMRRAAESARREIRRRRDEISRLRGEIGHLKGQPDPDQKAIAALEQRVAVLEEQLERDELSLDTLEHWRPSRGEPVGRHGNAPAGRLCTPSRGPRATYRRGHPWFHHAPDGSRTQTRLHADTRLSGSAVAGSTPGEKSEGHGSPWFPVRRTMETSGGAPRPTSASASRP